MTALHLAPDGDDALPTDVDLYAWAPCGLVLTSSDGRIQRANHAFCQWVGRDEASLRAQRFQDLLTMGGRIFHQTHLAPLLQMQGAVSEIKLDLLHSGGQIVPMVLNGTRRLHGASWVQEFALFVAKDRQLYERELLVARRRAEGLLIQEQEARASLAQAQVERDQQRAVAEDRALFAEQMMGIVSHDLRNPLSIIRMSAHLIGMGELSSNQMRALQRLTNSTMRAGRMIADLLDFTQARLGGGLKLNTATVDLHAAIAEGLEDLKLAFSGHQLIHQMHGAGPCVASLDRLIQLVGNLVANAMTYGAADQPVTVTSSISPHTFTVTVHNLGRPIAQESLAQLFAPLTRGEQASEGNHSIGLGLFIVKEIVTAHGGDIAVTSDAERGTTFTATFPRFGVG